MFHRRLLVLLMFLCSFATARALEEWPQAHSDLSPDPAATFGELDNGLRYVFIPHDEPPERLSLRLYVDAGSLMETEDQRGLAHFLEHMAFNGTEHYDAGEMVEYFQRLGMGFGADTNAHTWWKETVYKLELPEVNESLLNDSFQLLRDYADGMKLGAEELERERGVILSEKRSRDTVEYRAFKDEIQFLLPDSLIPNRLTIGEEDVIANAPREEFVDFYEKWYRPERMVLIAVGDTDFEKVKPYIEQYFSDFQVESEAPSEPDLGTISGEGVMARVHADDEAKAVNVSIQTVQPYAAQPDSIAERTRTLTRDVATAMIDRRLQRLAKQEDAPFSEGIAYGHDMLEFASTAGIELTTTAEQWQEALTVAEQQLRRALQYGFTEAELNEVRANLLTDLRNSAQQAPTRKARGIASGVVSSIRSESVFTHPEQELEIFTPILENLTPEACHEALRRLWNPEARWIFVSGNVSPDVTSEQAIEIYEQSQSTEVEPPADEEVAPFAYTDFGKPGEIVEKTVHEDLGITQLRLSNNVFVNYKQTDFEANSIQIALRFGKGLLDLPEDKPGLDLLASNVLIEGGLEEHSREELRRILAGKAVGLSFDVAEDAFLLAGGTTPEDLETELQLAAAYLTAPGYREEALRQAQKRFDQLFRQLAHTPSGVFSDQVTQYLASGDPRFGFPPREEVESRTLEEVRNWLQKPLSKERLEVSIVGDFEEDALIEVILSTLGALPERETKKEVPFGRKIVRFPRGEELKDFPFASEIPKAFAAVFWPTTGMVPIQQTRRLGLVSDILDDRLRKKIREELGEAYSPYTRHSASEVYSDYGRMMGLVICAPDQAEHVTGLVKELGAELAAEGADEDELERAIQPLLNQLEEWRRNNSYWLNNVLLASQETPERLEWARSMDEDFHNIELAEVNALAAKYLQPESALRIQVFPEAAEGSSAKSAGASGENEEEAAE